MKNKVLNTSDNTQIAVSEFTCSHAKAAIIVSGATGVPKRFYRHFALAANRHNFNVYTLDYRGIGDSAPPNLKGYEVNYLDWAKQDLSAVVEDVSATGLPIFLVGHSYGGHALGLLPNIHLIKGAYVFGVGAGWSGWMPKLERLKVNIMWHVLAPILVRLHGYMAWSKLGMGEDLPLGVYQQWKHWCQYPHYFFDDPDMRGIEETYARYTGPLVAVNAIDDKWAQPASRDAFVCHYKNATLKTINVDAKELGLTHIDHMGYFYKHAENLWLPIFDTFAGILEQHN